MIKLSLSNDSNGSVFVWKAEDVYKLRKCHRIVGALIGVHPYKSAQVKKHHLPLRLTADEAKLLLDKGLATLCGTPNELPSEAIIKRMHEKRMELCDEQVVISKETRKQEILMKCNDPEVAQKKSEQVKEVPKEDTYFQIFTECPWKGSNSTEMVPRYPSSLEEKVKYLVYKDLWEKKFYITCGSKFGGDFLVYAGDPYIFHSLYIVVCLPPSKKIQGFDIITYGRLGNQVKKTVVLASLSEGGEIDYISLEYVPEAPK